MTVCLPGTARHGMAELSLEVTVIQLSVVPAGSQGSIRVLRGDCMEIEPSKTLDLKLDEVSVFDWHEGATCSILTSVSHQHLPHSF